MRELALVLWTLGQDELLWPAIIVGLLLFAGGFIFGSAFGKVL